MAKTNTSTGKLFLAFGILTVISGIYLIFQKDYVIGISGSIVGAMIVYQNMKKNTE